jgi:hypothetical protein
VFTLVVEFVASCENGSVMVDDPKLHWASGGVASGTGTPKVWYYLHCWLRHIRIFKERRKSKRRFSRQAAIH